MYERYELYERYTNDMFDRFNLYFPSIAKQAVTYKADSPTTLIVELDDGTSVLWDDDNTSFRNLPSHGLDITESQHRREFGHRLRKIMIQRNITQSELAELIGLNQSQISNYIRGKTTPTWYMVDRIAKALNCSTDELRYNG